VFYLGLFRCLAQHDVRYLLVGGLAMNLLGVPRITMDIDLLLALDAASLDAFIQCARVLRLRHQIPEPLEALKDPERHSAGRQQDIANVEHLERIQAQRG